MRNICTILLFAFSFLFCQNVFSQSWGGGDMWGSYGWRMGNTSIGINTGAYAALHLYSATPNAHLAISGTNPGIKFNEGGTGFGADRATIGFATAAGQYTPFAIANDFVFRNNTDNGNIIFTTTSGLVEKMRITSNGLVGINTKSPSAKLHVVSSSSDISTPTVIFDFNSGGSSYPRLSLYQNFSTNPRNHLDATLYTVATNATTAAPLYLQTIYGGNVGIGYFGSPISTVTYDFQPQSKLQIQQGVLQITNSGDAATQTTGKTGLILGHLGDKSSTITNSYSWIQSVKGPLVLNPNSGNTVAGAQTNNYVAIGFIPDGTLTPAIPGGYNLIVKGKVMCEELKIKLMTAANWPDYVFASDYKLMTVDSLQSYIAQNNHLPDVPSAAEVEEDGIMAGEMNAVLLKKIEELTLYMIEQNKNAETQAAQIELLQKQNELLMTSRAMSDQAEQIQLLKEQNDLLMQQLTLLIQKK